MGVMMISEHPGTASGMGAIARLAETFRAATSGKKHRADDRRCASEANPRCMVLVD